MTSLENKQVALPLLVEQKRTTGKTRELESHEMVKFKKSTVKRIKHLFLIFLKQFDVKEFELLAKFLRVLLERFKQEPFKIFDYLMDNKENIGATLRTRKVKQTKADELRETRTTAATTSSDKLIKKEAVVTATDDDTIYIDDEQVLNKSDIIKSFAANSDDVATRTHSNGAVSEDKKNETTATVECDENEDELSVTSFGSSLDDYNYYNAKLFDDDDGECDEGDAGHESSLDEFDDEDSSSEREHTRYYNWHNKSAGSIKGNRRRSRRTQKYSDDIEEELERQFAVKQWLGAVQKRKLAKQLHLSEAQVQKWFVQRRERHAVLVAADSQVETPVVAASVVKNVTNNGGSGDLQQPEDHVGDTMAKKKGRGRPPKKRTLTAEENKLISDEVDVKAIADGQGETADLNGQVKRASQNEEKADGDESLPSSSSKDEENAPPLTRRWASNLRRKSLLERQQQKRQREDEAVERVGGTLRRRRANDSSAELAESTAAENSAKRIRLSLSSTNAVGRRTAGNGLAQSTEEALEKYFAVNSHPSEANYAKLCESTGLTIKQVKSWFSSRLNRQDEKRGETNEKVIKSVAEHNDDHNSDGGDEDEDEPISSSTSSTSASSAADATSSFSKQARKSLERKLGLKIKHTAH